MLDRQQLIVVGSKVLEDKLVCMGMSSRKTKPSESGRRLKKHHPKFLKIFQFFFPTPERDPDGRRHDVGDALPLEDDAHRPLPRGHLVQGRPGRHSLGKLRRQFKIGHEGIFE